MMHKSIYTHFIYRIIHVHFLCKTFMYTSYTKKNTFICTSYTKSFMYKTFMHTSYAKTLIHKKNQRCLACKKKSVYTFLSKRIHTHFIYNQVIHTSFSQKHSYTCALTSRHHCHHKHHSSSIDIYHCHHKHKQVCMYYFIVFFVYLFNSILLVFASFLLVNVQNNLVPTLHKWFKFIFTNCFFFQNVKFMHEKVSKCFKRNI